ncbi:hypothetical protein [Flavobacterium sp.]|uniref:hypothetical protein n=1 Tax=Flavobacterium sp. TaxID=239 RepID=UPI00262ECE9A|nr:hypothetical protein [Flavobacterium sp.]MDG2431786.1 hypothetical protein [Flavobacterium sp.]
MEKSNILYVGRNEEILNTVIRLINANAGWCAFGANTNAEAQHVFDTNTIAVVLLGSGISEESEYELREFFNKSNPRAIVVQHYGGGSGLLTSELTAALEEYNKKGECL